MNILHIVSNISIRNGIMSVLMNYYRHINNEEIKFSFLYFDLKSETYEQEIKALGGNVIFLSRKNFIGQWKQFCKEHFGQFDVIHNHELYLSLIMNNSKRMIGNKAIISHAHNTKFSEKPIKGLRNRFLSLLSIKSDVLLACSQLSGEKMFYYTFRNRGIVLNNAINVKQFEYNNEIRNNLRQNLNISYETLVVGHIGNFNIQKNHRFLIDIFYKLHQNNPNTVLLLIGTGELQNKIIEKAIKLNISKNIIFLGEKRNIYDYLNVMDLFVFPSKFEGLGIVLIEAQANGLPCLISDKVPQVANILKNKNRVLSLKQSALFWAENILQINNYREKIDDQFKKSGFDICIESKKLEKIYRKFEER